MATRRSQPQSQAKHDETDVPPHWGSRGWIGYWRERGWRPPNQANFTDPYQDRRFLLYASSLRDKFGYIRFVGLPTQGGPEDTPIEALYVEPALSLSRIDPNRPREEWTDTTPLIDAVINHPRLVVLGDPGSGKSTLVSWVVLSLLSREHNRLKDAVGPLVPLTLVLRDLSMEGEFTWDTLLSRFVEHPSGQALGSPKNVEVLLERGQAMVLVDGMDEAGGTEVRKKIAAALHNAFLRYPSIRWIVTSRLVGYDEAPVETTSNQITVPIRLPSAEWNATPAAATMYAREGMPVALRMVVVPFDDARVAMFVRNWHDQHETNRAERAARSAELIDAIHRSPQVLGLARIPNLLTMIALVYRVYLRLPDGRALLYERIAQAYLETIETARKLPTLGHTLEDMKRWLGFVAFQMQRSRFEIKSPNSDDGGIFISRKLLIEWIAIAMGKGKPEETAQHRATAIAFVDWVARRAGLIIPRSEDEFAFAHLSFQEYFSAWFLAEQVTGPAWNRLNRKPSALAAGAELATLQGASDNAQWHETFILLFELLAVRGEWADELLGPILQLTSDEAWPPKVRSEREREIIATRAQLLVALARDRHAGLSEAVRVEALQRAWQAWISVCASIDGQTFLNPPWNLAAALLERRAGDDDLPTLRALMNVPAPAEPVEVYISEGVTELVPALVHSGHDFSWIKGLYLNGHSVTDAIVIDLAHPDSGLKALDTLSFWETEVTDKGLSHLSRADAVLSALRSLYIHGTKITDEGIKEFTRAGNIILTVKSFGAPELMTDLGVNELTRADTAWKALGWLNLSDTGITDTAVRKLADPNCGLKVLTCLYLSRTKITDAGIKELARPNCGLKALTTLHLSQTKVTDQAVKDLARPDSGLRAVATLDLSHTGVTDAALKELARPHSGLKALTSLDLSHTKVTDEGVMELVRPDSGLEALRFLKISQLGLTRAEVSDLKEKRPNLTISY